MGMTYPRIRLIDGPLLETDMRRTDLVARMAKELIRQDTYHTERDAIRSLVGNGFSALDVMVVVDDARQVAMQHVVAMEMSRP